MLPWICRRGVLISVCSPVSDMLRYTACVREWMAADSRNVIAIHCKGGKGLFFDGVSMLYVNTVCLKCLMDWILFNRADWDDGVHMAYRQWPVWECTGAIWSWMLTCRAFLIQDFIKIFFKPSYRRVWTTLGRDGLIKAWVRSSRALKLPLRCVKLY